MGKTSLAKALARSIVGDGTPDPVHARPAAVGRRRRLGLEPRVQRVRVPARWRCSPTSCSPTRSTGRRRRRSPRCSRRWRSDRSPSTRATYSLPRPFLVIATQNPIELEGTYPLPEAQLDRFLMRLPMGYPSRDAEVDDPRDPGRGPVTCASTRSSRSHPPPTSPAAADAVTTVHVAPALQAYIVDLVDDDATASRPRARGQPARRALAPASGARARRVLGPRLRDPRRRQDAGARPCSSTG